MMMMMMMMLMLAGVWSVVVSLVTTPLLPNRLVTAPLSLSPLAGALLAGSGLATLLAVWWTVTAVSLLQHPTLVTMLRWRTVCNNFYIDGVVYIEIQYFSSSSLHESLLKASTSTLTFKNLRLRHYYRHLTIVYPSFCRDHHRYQ